MCTYRHISIIGGECDSFLSLCSLYDRILQGLKLQRTFPRLAFAAQEEERLLITMLARLLRRPLAASASQRMRTGLADFFEAGRDPNQDSNITYGTVLTSSFLQPKMAEFRVCHGGAVRGSHSYSSSHSSFSMNFRVLGFDRGSHNYSPNHFIILE